MMQSSEAVANYFIGAGVASGNPIDPVKLQRLIYFAHGWHLAIHGQPLIDERVEAWRYGPTAPSVYHHTKQNGFRAIRSLIRSKNP